MDDIDPSGFNADTYRIAFAKMSDKQFVDLMKKYIEQDDLNLFIDINQLEKKKSDNMTLERLKLLLINGRLVYLNMYLCLLEILKVNQCVH